jgi:hypothetical protein
MAKVPLTLGYLKTGKFSLNVVSAGLTPEWFFRLCNDNPELRLDGAQLLPGFTQDLTKIRQ